MSDLMLYQVISPAVAENIIRELSYYSLPREDKRILTMRIYSPGGDLRATWGIAAKLNEIRANGNVIHGKIDGLAASAAGLLLGYFDKVSALEVSNLMLHRAGYPDNDDGSPYKPDKEDQMLLESINADLKSRLSKIINNQKLIELKGVGLDELFDEKRPRINLWLSASDAEKIGLVNEVLPIDPVSKKEYITAVSACYSTSDNINNSKKPIEMTAKEFQEKHPDLYKSITEKAVAEYKKENPAPENKGGESSPVDISTEVEKQVEAKLSTLGLTQIAKDKADQTAQAQAIEEQAKKDKEQAESVAIADCSKNIEAITTGKKLN